MTFYRAFETRQLPVRVYRGPFISEDRSFDLSTALFHVTVYRQFARKVGTSANSALIRYYLPRLKLSSSTASALPSVVTQLHVLNSWHTSCFPGHMSIVSRVDHVLTKETSGYRFSAVIWPISTSCMLISQRITFYPQCHDFYARDSQHYKLMDCKEIGQSAGMRRRRVAAEPDASTRAFTLKRQPAAYSSRPLRTHADVV